MLQEERVNIFAGQDNAIGARIVGTSLISVPEREARELFGMLAIAPEDVSMPMQVVELIWCSHRGLTPPLRSLLGGAV